MIDRTDCTKEAGPQRFPRYSEYKNSGVGWLGEIPTHWKMRRLKDHGALVAGAGFPHDYQGNDDELLPFYKVRDLSASIDGRHMGPAPHTVSFETAAELRASIIPRDSIIYAKIGAALLLNRRRLTTTPCCIDNNMSAYVPRRDQLTSNWAFYWTIIVDFAALANPGAVPSLSEGDQADIPILIPPMGEQRSAAAFLDRETAKIDALVEKKERLIHLLQEKRTALITRVVTRGLDPNFPMKDSGVEWLGEVPAHWDVKKLKHLTPGTTVGIVVTPSKYYVDDGVPCLRSLNVSRGAVDTENLVFISENANELHRKSKIFAGDVVVVRTGQAGTAAVVPQELDGANCIDLLIVRRSREVLSQFVYYYLNSRPAISQATEQSVGAIQAHYNTSTLAQLVVPKIPPNEQRRIVEYLDEATLEIDRLMAKTREALEKLNELRTALISAAVTGKIDVREARPQ